MHDPNAAGREIKEYVTRRNEALREGGEKFDRLVKESGWTPSNDLVKEAARHKAILLVPTMSKAEKDKSALWLKQHGFHPAPGTEPW